MLLKEYSVRVCDPDGKPENNLLEQCFFNSILKSKEAEFNIVDIKFNWTGDYELLGNDVITPHYWLSLTGDNASPELLWNVGYRLIWCQFLYTCNSSWIKKNFIAVVLQDQNTVSKTYFVFFNLSETNNNKSNETYGKITWKHSVNHSSTVR
jgi:hypothetical protein